MNNWFEYKGISSEKYPELIVHELPPITRPAKRNEFTYIDGVDGAIVDEYGYDMVEKLMLIELENSDHIDEIISWLDGTGDITFSNEPDKVYKCTVYTQFDCVRYGRFRTASVVFLCQPYKYMKSETEIEGTAAGVYTVYNVGTVESLPLIEIESTGNVTITARNKGYGFISGGVVTPSSPASRVANISAILLVKVDGTQVSISSTSKTVDAADLSYDRIDIIYINSSNAVTYLAGTAAAIPVRPATPTGGIPVCSVYMEALNDAVDASDITDERPIMSVPQSTDAIVSYSCTLTMDATNNKLTVDSEAQDAYNTTTEALKNSLMTGDFPVLVVGENTISIQGTSITKTTIKPRSRFV